MGERIIRRRGERRKRLRENGEGGRVRGRVEGGRERGRRRLVETESEGRIEEEGKREGASD